LFEIGIAMSDSRNHTRRRWLSFGATAFGVCGILLLGLSYVM